MESIETVGVRSCSGLTVAKIAFYRASRSESRADSYNVTRRCSEIKANLTLGDAL